MITQKNIHNNVKLIQKIGNPLALLWLYLPVLIEVKNAETIPSNIINQISQVQRSK